MSVDERSNSADPVRTYLAELAAQLDGSDPALRHDALIDAEVHLRTAERAGTPIDRAIADFGTPAEVARAYRESGGGGMAPPTSASRRPPGAPPDAPPHIGFASLPIVGVWAQPAAWGALLYFCGLGLALSVFYFTWAVILGTLSLGLMPLIIGPPLLVLLLASVRGLSSFEGKIVEFFLRVRMPRRTQPIAGLEGVGFWKRIGCWLRDVRSWMSLGYLVGNLPVSILFFTITFTLFIVSLSLLAAPVFYALDMPMFRNTGDSEFEVWMSGTLLSGPDGSGTISVVSVAPIFILGLALMTATLWVARGFGWVYGRVVQAIQVVRPQ
jgi:hypothetical protein